MARFEKGAERPMNAGRKLGSVNKTTPLLKDAILLAGCVAGGRLVEREIIERRARDAAENDSPESAGELKQAVEENGSLVGYLSWLALEHPTAYAPLLGRVLPLQIRVDSPKDRVYRTVEEIKREIRARVPRHVLESLLIDDSSSDSPENRDDRLRGDGGADGDGGVDGDNGDNGDNGDGGVDGGG
jgi:hypothetical protein